MGLRPYNTVVRDGDSLVFEADLPAFAAIGKRYGQVEDARLQLASKLVLAPGDPKTGPGNAAYAADVRAKRAQLPPSGRYRFDCGDLAEPTEHQKALFDKLEKGHAAIFQEVAEALRAMYRQEAASTDRNDPYQQVVYLADDSGDVPLDRFRIHSFLLHPSADRIGLTFDSLLERCEELGCAVVVSAGKLEEFGGRDVLELFYEDTEDDELDDEGSAFEDDEFDAE